MNIYNEIITWSTSQPMFIRDGIRRILTNPVLSIDDVNELLLLLKQEVGFKGITLSAIPVTVEDIPASAPIGINTTKLLSIEKPININALYSEAVLNFSIDGLTVVYGNNGSGKSSYARILKKLCWSRNKNIKLKKNVHTGDTTRQSVKIKFNDSANNILFDWQEDQNTHFALNSIYLFDTDCASIYLNSETPTEYKPVGLDVLEKLIILCNQLNSMLETEANACTSVKPLLEAPKFDNVQLAQWYNTIETIDRNIIDVTLVFNENNRNRKLELARALLQNNPVEENIRLTQKLSRYNTIKEALFLIEKYFSPDNKIAIENIKQTYFTKKQCFFYSVIPG